MSSYSSARRLLPGLPLGVLCAAAAAQPAGPLADYSLEQLSQVIVTSVGRPEVSLQPGGGGGAENNPDHYWRLHPAHELGRGIVLDLELRGVACLPEPHVPSYHELDVRLAWHAAPGSEAFVAGRNLLHCEHPEFGPAATRQLVGRSVLFNLSWRY